MPDKNKIFVHHTGIAEDILGPGKRVVVWMSGCPFRCKGCIEPKLHDISSGAANDIEQFYHSIEVYLKSLGRVTFSGGEPLYQKQAFLRLLKEIPTGVDTMLFTGYESSIFIKEFREIYNHIDIAVTGRFIEEKHSNTLWRGSANQEIISPSKKYDHFTLNKWYNSTSAGIQVHFVDGWSYIYGVPPKGLLNKVDKFLQDSDIDIESKF